MALSDELAALGELRAKGTLSEDEFTRAKARLINGEPSGTAPAATAVNRFRRAREDRWIGGVCGGLARVTGMEAWAWRLIFTAVCLVGGAGVLLYLLLWIFVPTE